MDAAVALSPKTLPLKSFHLVKALVLYGAFQSFFNASYPSDVGG